MLVSQYLFGASKLNFLRQKKAGAIKTPASDINKFILFGRRQCHTNVIIEMEIIVERFFSRIKRQVIH